MEKLGYKNIRFDEGVQAGLLVILFGQLFMENGLYLFFGTAVLYFTIYNLQQPLKPSIFTIIFLYHYIQIAANIWLSNYTGTAMSANSPHLGEAIIASFVGLFVMFIPILYFQHRIPDISMNILRKHASRLSIEKSFKAYIIAFFTVNLLAGVAFVIPGLTQIIYSFINIKWVLFIIFGLQVFLKRRYVKHLVALTAIEFVLGFMSYFSDFKTVFFILGFILISFVVHVRIKHFIIGILALSFAVFLGVKWTAIKGEYRAFLNQGANVQKVTVSGTEALNKLIELGSGETEQEIDDPIVEFLVRIQYTFHLAKTMDRIPAEMPYEYGGNIGNILSFVTTPRFLNPDKPKYYATEKTKKYTGLAYVGAESGTSFSLGYFADCYIDFGTYGMMFPLLCLGFIFGGSYFYFVRRSSNNFIFNFAVVGAMYLEFHGYEADGTYLMGRLFATLLTFFVLRHFFFPWLYNQVRLPRVEVSVASTAAEVEVKTN